MGKGYKTGLLIILILIIAILSAYVYSRFFYKKHKTEGFSVVVDKIDKFGYTLDERDSKLMRSKFKELKKVLKKDEIDYEKYATLLAEMYIIDLYDINNKVNKYDVPCLEYLFKDELDKFKLMIKNEFYSKLIDNSNNDRKQELPTVKDITVVKVEETKFEIKEVEYDGYSIELEWEYDKDLGYDKKAEVIIVKSNDKLYVAKHSPIID
jgi:hypothetical protein